MTNIWKPQTEEGVSANATKSTSLKTMMNIEIITICLDAMPWVTYHLPEFERLQFPFRWHVIEGVAANMKCTSWCESMVPRLSNDGTTEYLDSIAAYDKRVIIHRKESWCGKVAMMNEPLRYIHWPCLLMQIDSDEIWQANQIATLRNLFMRNPKKDKALFYCDYRLGPHIRITSRNTFGNNTEYEWRRAWRRMPGQFFKSHEPPVLERNNGEEFTHQETEASGLVFRHEAYSTEAQVAFKAKFYGGKTNEKGKLYADSVDGWRRLQQNTAWPVDDLSQYMAFVGPGVKADKI